METLSWIQGWFKSHCNGNWEHSYGIKIETLDNPGWQVKIDLEGTDLEGTVTPYELIEKSDNDWYGYKIQDSVFHAAGDPDKLGVLLELFRGIAEAKTSG